MKKISLLVLFTLLFTGLSWAQSYTTKSTTNKKAQKLFAQGEEAMLKGDFENMKESLLKAIEADPVLIDAYELMGEYYFAKAQWTDAVTNLEKVISLKEDYKSKTWHMLGNSYWALDNYEGAVTALTRFLQFSDAVGPWVTEDKRKIANAKFAVEAMKHPVPFKPINLGDSINSSFREYFPSVSGDEQTLVFTRLLKEGTKLQEDFFIAHQRNGVWSRARSMGAPVNTPQNEGAQNISASGTWLFFTGCSRPGGFGECDLYSSEKINGVWTEPRNLGQTVNTPSWESQPSISADGKTLYFSSLRKGGAGGEDLWMSRKDDDGKWEMPVNLGKEINTPFDEETPFIHPDNQTLYFSSGGHEGMGGIDIFMSRKKPDGTWGKPVNLGYPLNTKGDEHSFIVSLDGKHGYFSSDMKNDGNLDLYVFDIYDAIKPALVTYLNGYITNAATGEYINADVQLIDLENGKVINSFTSDKTTGYYMVSIPVGKNYALNVSKKNFLFHSENFSLKDYSPEKPYKLDIKLEPIALNTTPIVLKNIFFETNSTVLKTESFIELDKLIQLLRDNPPVGIQIGGHTDNVGSDADNLKLSEGRAKAVYDYLVSKRIEASRLSYKGYGETKPIADNATEEGRALNRRTDFSIVRL